MRCIIVASSDIKDYELIKKHLNHDDYFIYCDGGLRHEAYLEYEADLIVGDFDSYQKPNRNTPIIALPKEKDDTDSIYAIKEGIKRGFKEFILVGVLGKRIDHSLANIGILEYLYHHNVKGQIIDDYGIVELLTDNARVSKDYLYFSLINIYGNAKGITITGAKYPLEDASISTDYQYAISNEVLNDEASISIKEGKLLLIKGLKL